jgi:Cu(I)/Ag(I) efflux system periplasmic protein CusF
MRGWVAARFSGLVVAMIVAFGAGCYPALAQQDALIGGRVIKVERSADKITIRHGPIPKLGMNQGMAMTFHARDPALLKSVKAGDRVKFDAEEVNGEFTVTRIQKAK